MKYTSIVTEDLRKTLTKPTKPSKVAMMKEVNSEIFDDAAPISIYREPIPTKAQLAAVVAEKPVLVAEKPGRKDKNHRDAFWKGVLVGQAITLGTFLLVKLYDTYFETQSDTQTSSKIIFSLK